MVKCGYSERCSGSASSTQEESQLLKVPEHSGFVSIACKKFLWITATFSAEWDAKGSQIPKRSIQTRNLRKCNNQHFFLLERKRPSHSGGINFQDLATEELYNLYIAFPMPICLIFFSGEASADASADAFHLLVFEDGFPLVALRGASILSYWLILVRRRAGGKRTLQGVTHLYLETRLHLANSLGLLCTTGSLFFQSAVQTLYWL